MVLIIQFTEHKPKTLKSLVQFQFKKVFGLRKIPIIKNLIVCLYLSLLTLAILTSFYVPHRSVGVLFSNESYIHSLINRFKEEAVKTIIGCLLLIISKIVWGIISLPACSEKTT